MIPTFRSGRFSIHIWAGIAYNLKPLLVVLPLAPRKKRPGLNNQWDPAEKLTAVRYCDWIINSPLGDVITAASTYPDGLSNTHNLHESTSFEMKWGIEQDQASASRSLHGCESETLELHVRAEGNDSAKKLKVTKVEMVRDRTDISR
ncbi:uncharacterized protein UHOD_11582 [Ustilago sp. UG-2017b]|nr:uncharacterized protein UHOD_11582 [Ustilago sp. UG-2017b]